MVFSVGTSSSMSTVAEDTYRLKPPTSHRACGVSRQSRFRLTAGRVTDPFCRLLRANTSDCWLRTQEHASPYLKTLFTIHHSFKPDVFVRRYPRAWTIACCVQGRTFPYLRCPSILSCVAKDAHLHILDARHQALYHQFVSQSFSQDFFVVTTRECELLCRRTRNSMIFDAIRQALSHKLTSPSTTRFCPLLIRELELLYMCCMQGLAYLCFRRHPQA